MPETPTRSEPPPEPGGVHDAHELAEMLANLGAETRARRQVNRVLPWIVSYALHLGLGGLAFVITWSVVNLSGDEDPPIVVADFDALQYEPLTPLSPNVDELDQTAAQDILDVPPEVDAHDIELTEGPSDALEQISNAMSRSSLAEFAPAPRRESATFAGLRASNARRIVYVVDASGSMIGSLPIVLQEVARSVDALRPPQEFGLVFFQHNEAIVAPPRNRLRPATTEDKREVLEWASDKRNVFPSGRSNPLRAIEVALALEPDAIFLLSNNITGSGEFEIDQADLLDLLDRLNPVDAETGRRQSVIQCIQFLDPDPLDTLRRIAETHGGPRGYRFLDRQELGLTTR